MKFTAEKAPLLAAINKASLPVGRAAMPTLECLKIVADDRLRFYGTNLDIEVRAEAKAGVLTRGVALANAADLKAIVSAAPADAALTLEVDGGALIVSGPGISVRLMTPPADGFPTLTPDGEMSEVSGIANALSLCAPFASREEVKFHMKGVCIDGDFAVASDGARIARLPIECAARGPIIPLESIPVILKLLGLDGRLWVGSTTWRLENEGIQAAGRLVDGQFPGAWRQIMVADEALAAVKADDLLAACNASTLGRAELMVITSEGGTLTLSGDRFGGVHVESKIDCPAKVKTDFCAVMSSRGFKALVEAFGERSITISGEDGRLRFDADSGLSAAMMTLRDTRNRLPEKAVAA